MINTIDTIFFDLDGTLLLMDQDQFLKHYFDKLANKFAYEGKKLITAVQSGVTSMLKNNGAITNKKAFWNAFLKFYPDNKNLELSFLDFYKNEFQELKKYTSLQPRAREVINILKNKGYDLIVCTNPVFPKIATISRIMWAGLDYNDFSLITTYENSHYCKPNFKYYEEVLQKTNKKPSQVLMVGNDVLEDLSARKINIKTFLVEDNLLNYKNLPVESEYHGLFNDFYKFVVNLPRKV